MVITKLASKCARGINEQLLKTSGADVLSSMKKEKKNQKNLREGGNSCQNRKSVTFEEKVAPNGLFFELAIEKRLISVLVLLRGE